MAEGTQEVAPVGDGGEPAEVTALMGTGAIPWHLDDIKWVF